MLEDDIGFATMLGELLASRGYKVCHFFEAVGAMEWLKEHRPELIISDIRMPGVSGIQFCRRLREGADGANVPVIMLSALSDEVHRVEALRSGADDYVCKPFSSGELLARIEALLRRCYGHRGIEQALVSGKLKLNYGTAEVFLDKERIELLPKEYGLLFQLLKSGGRVLAYSYLAEAVWGEDNLATRNTIKSTMSRLRLKLGESGKAISAIPGLGYKWTGE